jgi:hypothetical protein
MLLMASTSKPVSTPTVEQASAQVLARRWRTAAVELESERLRELRSLSDQEAVHRFAKLLSVHGRLGLRESSGLVEQQRIFARLRARSP